MVLIYCRLCSVLSLHMSSTGGWGYSHKRSGLFPLLNNNAKRLQASGVRVALHHYTQLAYSVLQRGPWHLQQGRSTTRARQTPPSEA